MLERRAQKPCDDAPGLPAPQQVTDLFAQEHSLCHRPVLSPPQLTRDVFMVLESTCKQNHTPAVGLGVSSRQTTAGRGRVKSRFNHTLE